MSKRTRSHRGSVAVLTETVGRAAEGTNPYNEALVCLHESGVYYSLLRDNPDQLNGLADLDVLIHPKQKTIAFAALQRAGFLPKIDRRLKSKWVLIHYRDGRFYTIDLHGALVQGGIVYMDGVLALSRRDETGTFPQLCPEDKFVHILLHNALGKPGLQAKHTPVLQVLLRQQLDLKRIEQQTKKYKTHKIVDAALNDFQRLVKDEARWKKMSGEVRGSLMRSAGNQWRSWQYKHGGGWRLRRRPLLLALLGPDGTGKSTLLKTLETVLADSPLRAGRVYMGSWGHDQLGIRLIRRLIPPRISYARVLSHLLRNNVRLSVEEKEYIRTKDPNPIAVAWATVRYGLKSAIFYCGLMTEMTYRYMRFIRRCKRPLVICDRYIYDLEFRQGRNLFSYGSGIRRFIYRIFPKPDGILYLSAPYAVVQARKPQLSHEQFVAMDKGFRQVLHEHAPLELFTDRPAEEVARKFLEQHWEHLLERINQRA